MYHNFLIHLSVEQLCCFHVLAVVNSAVMNIEVHVSLSLRNSSWLTSVEKYIVNLIVISLYIISYLWLLFFTLMKGLVNFFFFILLGESYAS